MGNISKKTNIPKSTQQINNIQNNIRKQENEFNCSVYEGTSKYKCITDKKCNNVSDITECKIKQCKENTTTYADNKKCMDLKKSTSIRIRET